MRAFHGRPGGAPQLRITVVHDDGAFLAQTAALLRREAEELDMAFSFHPVMGRLETLELGNLHRTLAIRSGDARAFSSALQMHRLLAVDDTQTQQIASMAPLPQLAAPEVVKTSLLDPSPTTPLSPFAAQASPSASSPEHPQRAAAVVPPLAAFLSAVRAVSPKVVCVMEQDAGDNVADLAARFEEALHHYAAVFEALDDAAGVAHRAREERAAVERVLLWEEVKDVLARDGSERRERHERLHQWAARMAGAGFAGVPLSYVAKMEADAELRKCGLRGYETRGVEGGCLLLCRSGWPLYSISAWRPWPSQGSASSGSGSSRQPQLMAVPGQIGSTWTAWPQLLPPPVDHTH
ncbi:scarecrow-like protein 3 [Miscanthus floridulus]|uniref:scarecrow-like protein 3 n=1 Tax=Miscanthus floridulus TaxID=154761 RepID=UPI00345947D2